MSIPALAGQHAIVVGGGSGIGLGTARLLARDGAHVTIAGRTEQRLRNACAELAGEDLELDWVRCDAMNGDDVRAAVDQASNGGKLNIAVNVPGGGKRGGVLMYEDDDFCAVVEQNVKPAFLLLKYAGRAMVRAGGGSFVAVSSTVAAFSFRYQAPYGAGKAAVDQLVKVAADELGEAGVRVNSVRPGLTRTAVTAKTFADEELLEKFVAGQPIARPGEVADIAAAIRFLAGPESSWITGQLLAVDGGHTLRAAPDFKTMMEMPDQVDLVRAGTLI